MAGEDETMYGGTTILDSDITDNEDMIKPGDSPARYQDDGTVPDVAASGPKNNEAIEKGADLLGIYCVESDAIKGGMGKVWRVRHTGWNVDLALKQPKQELFQNERQKENFIHECEAWINLGLHPHIVSCYYVREIGGVPSIFSEWMEGGSLKDWIYPKEDEGQATYREMEGGSLKDRICPMEDGGQTAEKEAVGKYGRLYEGDAETVLKRVLDIAIQFVRGLRYAHEQGLIHQDVKPDNLLLTKEGDAKVADFGIARARAALGAVAADIQGGGTIVSDAGGYTPAYCSPEQAEGDVLTRRTDIYSWAVSVLEMFLGERKWDHGTIAGAACEDYFEMSMRVAIPGDMKALLTRCLAMDPGERPHDFGEVDAELLRIYQDVAGRAYFREISKAAPNTADSLNNQALSFLDLGKPEEAEKRWERALVIAPNHDESFFNRTIHQWRNGQIDDMEVLRLLSVNLSEIKDYYLAKIQFARGNAEIALERLDKVKDVIGETEDIRIMAGGARSRIKAGRGRQCCLTFSWHKHKGSVNSACFSPDGKLLLSGSSDKTIKLWDMKTGECIRTLKGHEGPVWSAGFNHDGQTVISSSEDKTIVLWDTATGQRLHTIKGHQGSVNSVSFSPDGLTALSGSDDKTVKLWDTTTGECLRTLNGHNGGVNSVSFSPDGNMALSASDDCTTGLWDMATGERVRTFGSIEDKNNSASFSPDGRRAIIGKYSRFELWDIETGECLDTFEWNNLIIESVCFSPDGQTALSSHGACSAGKIKLWDLATKQCLCTFEDIKSETNTASFSPDGRMALSGDWNGTLQLWFVPEKEKCEMALSKVISTEKLLRDKAVFDAIAAEIRSHVAKKDIAAALPILARLAEAPQFGKSPEYRAIKKILANHCVFGKLAGYQKRVIKDGRTPVSFSPDGKALISGGYSGDDKENKAIKLWDAATGGRLRTFDDFYTYGLAVSFSPDGKTAISGSERNSAIMWDIATGECLFTFEGHTKPITSTCFSPCGKIAASASADGSIRLWDLTTGHCVRTLEGHESGVHAAAFSPDGRTMISSSASAADSALKLWDISAGQCIRAFEGHESCTFSAGFSPDGSMALSGSFDKTIKLWDIATGVCIRTFESDRSIFCSVAFSPDGKRAVSGCRDGTLMLWDVETWELNHTFEEQKKEIKSVCFNPDGTQIASASNLEIIIYDLDYELVFPGWRDWADGALPYAGVFFTLHPNYSNDDFQNFIIELQNRGYGWLRPEGVRYKLDELQFG